MRIQLRFLSVASLEFQVNLNAQYRTLKHEGYRFSVTDNRHLQDLFSAPQQVKALYNNGIILQLILHSDPLGSDDL